jgi:hypothetical protein
VQRSKRPILTFQGTKSLASIKVVLWAFLLLGEIKGTCYNVSSDKNVNLKYMLS